MDRAGIFTLADFISQLSDFVVRQPDEALAATQAETANVVRLMSIHQSKGLEFPVVVVPDLETQKPGLDDARGVSPDLGPLVRHPQGSGAQRPGTVAAGRRTRGCGRTNATAVRGHDPGRRLSDSFQRHCRRDQPARCVDPVAGRTIRSGDRPIAG